MASGCCRRLHCCNLVWVQWRCGIPSRCHWPMRFLFSSGWLETNAQDYIDAPDLSGVLPTGQGGGECHAPLKSGGDGDFGGGGASGSFDGPGDAVGEAVSSPMKTVSDSVASVAEADELAILWLRLRWRLELRWRRFMWSTSPRTLCRGFGGRRAFVCLIPATQPRRCSALVIEHLSPHAASVCGHRRVSVRCGRGDGGLCTRGSIGWAGS